MNKDIKICNTCNMEKNILEFYLIKRISKKDTKYKPNYQCKDCDKIKQKNYNIKNLEKRKDQCKRSVVKNKIKINKKRKEKRNKNTEKERINNNKYYYKNKLKINIQARQRRINNNKIGKKRIYNKEKTRINYNKKYDSNPFFKLKKIISKTIREELKNNNLSKNNNSCLKYLKYTIKELKNHIELLFESWMNWDNWGTYNLETYDLNPTWNLDHIIPQSKLHYISMEDENFKICWSLNNLRPYSSKQNILDGNRR